MANGSTALERADRAERRLARERDKAEHAGDVVNTGIGFAGTRAGTTLLPKLLPAAEPWMMPVNIAIAFLGFRKAFEGDDDSAAALGVGLAGATPVIDYGVQLLTDTIAKFTGK